MYFLDNMNAQECPICMKISCLIELGNCKHCICNRCAIKWSEYESTCPICRKVYDVNQHMSYFGNDTRLYMLSRLINL